MAFPLSVWPSADRHALSFQIRACGRGLQRVELRRPQQISSREAILSPLRQTCAVNPYNVSFDILFQVPRPERLFMQHHASGYRRVEKPYEGVSAMSALGQKQKCAVHKPMSALPSKADMCIEHTVRSAK